MLWVEVDGCGWMCGRSVGNIAVVNEWLLPAYVPRNNGEEDEERSAR
jgi:hypothetical protein